MPDSRHPLHDPISLLTLSDSSIDRWDDYVAGCKDATFFHRAGWKRVIEKSFGQECFSLAAERDGTLVGVLPLAFFRSGLFGRGLIANGCCMGGAPIADDSAAFDALDDAAIALMEKLRADFLEYRRPARPHADWVSRDDLYATFARDIEPEEAENLKQIPRKQRAVLRKSLEGGLVDSIDSDIDRFYPLYATTVHRLGTPVFGKAYFRRLLEEFGGDCDILTVTKEGKPLTSVLSFYFRDSVMPYYAGAGEGAREAGANDFMYWRLMRRAVARGYGRFDFGRSKLGSGPFAFKRNWGFEAVPVRHEYRTRQNRPIPEINPLNPKYRLFIALWQRLPLGLANLVGPHIVRNIG
jgi:FemAB-related protein (PEP-CTERM system-associated)